MNKILTVVIPAYNMGKYLERCLSSLLVADSLMPKFEVLVINDGSKDNTSQIAHQFEMTYPDTFRVIDKENGHYGSCINRGLVEAKGIFVKILDADDTFNIDAFSSFINFLSEKDIINNADVVVSDFSEVEKSGAIRRVVHFSRRYTSFFNLCDLTVSDKQRWFIHGLTYKTELLRQIDYHQTEGITYTDLEWSFVPIAYVKNLVHFDLPLYLYSVGREDQSINDTIHAQNLWMEVEVVEGILEYFSRENIRIPEANRAFLSDRIFIMVTHIYELYLIAYRHLTADDRIKQFDFKLKSSNFSLYSKLEKHSTKIGGIPFHFIRNWRKQDRVRLWIQSVLYSSILKLKLCCIQNPQ